MAPTWCPQTLTGLDKKHVLENASLFDTPPINKADLTPDVVGQNEAWDPDRIDPYLVCRYSGTTKVVTLHPVGAKSCTMLGGPFRACCE